MKRRKIYAANWKMYKTDQEAISFLEQLLPEVSKLNNHKEIIIFPPSLYAESLQKINNSSFLEIGLQNVYFEEEGAFTGEISPKMIKGLGLNYVLVGHSERRHLFGESNQDIQKKVNSLLNFNLKPVLCVGEKIEQREAGLTEKIIKEQLETALNKVQPSQLDDLIIAYEPVWAIGTGKVATPEIAEEVHLNIRRIVKDLYTQEKADSLIILYGGSVKPENVASLNNQKNIDGFLIGGASLKVDSFLEIIKK
jgi:triosephosphate isomerase